MTPMIEKIIIKGNTARLVTSEGAEHVLKLAEFALGIAEETVQGRTETPNTDHVRWRIRRGVTEVIILELTPELRALEWLESDSPVPFGRDAKCRRRQLATPYVVVKVPFRRGCLTQRVEVFYRTAPLSSLDGPGGELCFPNLLNVSPHAYHCTSWFCTQYLKVDGVATDTTDALDAVVQHLWGGQFNASSEHNEGDSGFSLTVKSNVDPRVADVDRWEKESQKHPSFVLQVPWKPTGMTVGQVIDAELAHQHANVPPSTGVQFRKHPASQGPAALIKGTQLMHLPVELKQRTRALPRLSVNESRYVIADNGIYLERRGAIHYTCTRVRKSNLCLDEQNQFCTLNCGKLPSTLHQQMLAFFYQAHRIHGGEAALVLLYDPPRRQFHWHCPVQTVELHESHRGWYASDHIEFDNPIDLPDGFMQLGDAHLHPGAPHPSMTDVYDDQDGLHLIVGNIDRTPTYHIDFVMDRVRFNLDPKLFFEDPACLPQLPAPEEWIDQIRMRACRSSTTNEDA